MKQFARKPPSLIAVPRPIAERALFYAALLMALAFALPTRAAVFLVTVGDDAACDFRTSTSANALQAAIDSVPVVVSPGDFYVVRVARTGNYLGASALIEDRSLLLDGGVANCSVGVGDSDRATIDRAGSNGAVIEVRGIGARESVTLRNLILRGAAGVVATGLRVRNADVVVENTLLRNNAGAIRGAGLDVDGAGLGASVRLTASSAVLENQVLQEGGGIFCYRGAHLEVDASVAVLNNDAQEGGGLYIDGCTGYANSGAEGLAALFINIGFNTAGFAGGGLFLGSESGPTRFTLGQDAGSSKPRVAILENSASTQGGGIFVAGDDTELTINNAIISGNSSGSLGGGIQMRNGPLVNLRSVSAHCLGIRDCSFVSSNTAPLGAAFSVAGTGSELQVSGTRIESNTASSDGSAVYLQQGNAFVQIENSFIVENGGSSVFFLSDPLSSAPRATQLTLLQTTVAANTGTTEVFNLNTEGTLQMGRSIINDDASTPVILHTGSYTPDQSCNFVHEVASISPLDANSVFSTTPGFVNAGSGNFHLTSTASATDRCAASAIYSDLDYDRQQRPIDAPLLDTAGPFDMGADEWSASLFADGFE